MSFGIGCAKPGVPGVYTDVRVSSFALPCCPAAWLNTLLPAWTTRALVRCPMLAAGCCWEQLFTFVDAANRFKQRVQAVLPFIESTLRLLSATPGNATAGPAPPTASDGGAPVARSGTGGG